MLKYLMADNKSGAITYYRDSFKVWIKFENGTVQGIKEKLP